MTETAAYAIGQELGFEDLVGTLRAVAEPTRLRLVALLSHDELTVTEISRVIGQSQPRTSRHLRLLVDAGILERAPEGVYVYYRLADESSGGELARAVASLVPDGDETIAADLAALARVRRARIEAAAAYRSAHAQELAGLHNLYVGEAAVERALLDMLVGEGPIGRLLDIGTGTGRILELLAPHTEQSVGLDVDHEMLQLARATLGEAQLSQVAVRQGDVHRPPFEAGSFDVAVMHHVLHLLDEPGEALVDAARLLRPGGRLLVVDFAAHDLVQLRELYGHCRLGIDQAEMAGWAESAGLDLEGERSLAPSNPDELLTVRLWLLRAHSRNGRAEVAS
ncbi:MAG TPA: metalloregulator ArsR/SmtB family transcription factor [Solirubrobacteraceae bacterium]|nr:metalloregulator ArsR/SmtB family transcription factor [Solirubrobacteraceae bacterium]